jgi:hypothetical protein
MPSLLASLPLNPSLYARQPCQVGPFRLNWARKVVLLRAVLRAFFLVLAIGAVALVGAAGEDPEDKVRTVEPQAVIAIEHVDGTGDVVQMHYKGGVYDEPSIKAAIADLAKQTGAQVANYQFMPGATAEDVSKVFFVTQNLVDVSSGDIRLQPVVRAFMKGAKGTVESFSVRIQGIKPNPYNTLASYQSDEVALKAFVDPASTSIEYRILVMTDDPAKVAIPPRHIPDEMVTQPFDEPKKDKTPMLLGLILLAGASAGALVYFVLLGKRS